MSKLQRITGKTFGATASATGDASNGPYIGQFGSAKIGSYNGTTDVATIQGLSAWSNGFIDAVTPQNQYPPLPEMTGALKVLSYQENYLLQNGVAEWDENTDYHTNQFCRVDNKLYYSLVDNNVGNSPSESDEYWAEFSPGERYLISSFIDGTTWYRTYSDGWIEQGGYAYSTATQVTWTSPSNMQSNGIWNGNSFAVKGTDKGYLLFDGDTTTDKNTANAGGQSPFVLTVYNPTPVKFTLYNQVAASSYAQKYPPQTVTIAISNDEVEWTNLVVNVALNRADKSQTPIALNTNTYAKYMRMTYINNDYTAQCYLKEVMLKGVISQSAQNSIAFPIEFRDTNYSFQLSYEGASGADIYASSKSTTGITLNNPSGSTNVCWYACGY